MQWRPAVGSGVMVDDSLVVVAVSAINMQQTQCFIFSANFTLDHKGRDSNFSHDVMLNT